MMWSSFLLISFSDVRATAHVRQTPCIDRATFWVAAGYLGRITDRGRRGRVKLSQTAWLAIDCATQPPRRRRRGALQAVTVCYVAGAEGAGEDVSGGEELENEGLPVNVAVGRCAAGGAGPLDRVAGLPPARRQCFAARDTRFVRAVVGSAPTRLFGWRYFSIEAVPSLLAAETG